MVFSFRCKNCRKRKFFSSYSIVNQEKICEECTILIQKRNEAVLLEQQKARILIKQKKRKENQKKADELLRKELALEKEKQKFKEKKALEKKHLKKQQKSKEQYPKTKIIFLFDEAKALSKKFDKVLYVYADVKNLKVVEFINGRERIALNKEREIRRTHKGGFSQEKFQKFVDFKKKHTIDWVEDLLSRKGVLKLPYDKIVVDSHNLELMTNIQRFLDKGL